jgi:hypothetical protein
MPKLSLLQPHLAPSGCKRAKRIHPISASRKHDGPKGRRTYCRGMSKMIPNILTNVEWIVQVVAGVPTEKVRDLILVFRESGDSI